METSTWKCLVVCLVWTSSVLQCMSCLCEDPSLFKTIENNAKQKNPIYLCSFTYLFLELHLLCS